MGSVDRLDSEVAVVGAGLAAARELGAASLDHGTRESRHLGDASEAAARIAEEAGRHADAPA
jgi:hypothetical protein